jgi:hypothetical protein
MVVQALLLLGQLVDTSNGTTVNGIRRLRRSFEIGAAALLEADELLYSGRYREVIRASFSRRGIEPHDIRDRYPVTDSKIPVAERAAKNFSAAD